MWQQTKKGHTQAKHKKVCVIQLNHQRRELGANQKVKSGGVQGEPKSKRQAKTKIKPNMKNPSIYNIIRWFPGQMGQTTRQTSV